MQNRGALPSSSHDLGEYGQIGVSANTLGAANNPVTNAAATRPTGLARVWWYTATQPTNWQNGDVWEVAQ